MIEFMSSPYKRYVQFQSKNKKIVALTNLLLNSKLSKISQERLGINMRFN